jgi:hypothetical protein
VAVAAGGERPAAAVPAARYGPRVGEDPAPVGNIRLQVQGAARVRLRDRVGPPLLNGGGVYLATQKSTGRKVVLKEARPHAGLDLHGIAYAFEEIGRREAALEVLELAGRAGEVSLADELLTGRSGVALNQLFFARRLGDRQLRQTAVEAAGRLAERLVVQPPRPEGGRGRPRRAGLLHGASGPALLFVRLFEETGENAFLDLAERALRQDLDRCVHVEEQDVLYVGEGRRSVPYVGTGSAGIGLVPSELLRHRDDEELRTALRITTHPGSL